jgi:Beta protein
MAEASGPDVVYMPLLKGRAGELRALFEISETTASRLTPLIEIPLIADESDSDEPFKSEITGDTRKFAEDIKRRWSPDRRFIFDASVIPPTPNVIPTVDLIDSFASADYTVTPTVRPSDEEWIIRRIGESIHEWSLNSACIRLGGDDLDDRELPLPVAINRALDWLQLTPKNVDLVLDFRSVIDENAVSFMARIARLVLSELPHTQEWRTLVCAAGAFPPDLNSIQSEVLTEISRHDAAMWNAVKERIRGRVPIFGDYGIAYPGQAAGVPFAPAPQLRFTAAQNWLVMKGRRQDRRGAKQFYDICERVAAAAPVDPQLSWGDRYVADAARSASTGDALVKTGNAMIWRAIGTSHHIAYVAKRLATLGVP